jgi:hypothetical protein
MAASESGVVGVHTPRAFDPPTANVPSSEEVYRDLMGHPPPEDRSEGAWQWSYRGTPAELFKLCRDVEGDPPDQMGLF